MLVFVVVVVDDVVCWCYCCSCSWCSFVDAGYGLLFVVVVIVDVVCRCCCFIVVVCGLSLFAVFFSFLCCLLFACVAVV